MRIVYSGSGQLANRVWSVAIPIAESLEQGESTLIVNFNDYRQYFPNLTGREHLSFFPFTLPVPNSLMERAVSSLARYGVPIVSGWDRRKDHRALARRDGEIRHLFSPAEAVIRKCMARFDRERATADHIVGIHWRRGDYADYMGGRYYYDDETIRRYMGQIAALLPESRTKFFIATNEPFDARAFSEFDCFFHHDASSMMEDLFSLSLCDWIAGPPSTFSMWASFYGDKPLRILSRSDEKLDLSEFDRIVAVDVFARMADNAEAPSAGLEPD